MPADPRLPAGDLDSATWDMIHGLARIEHMPDGTSTPVIGATAEMEIAKARGIRPRLVQQIALRHGVVPRRYLRNQHGYDSTAQLRMLSSTVAMVGLGGLGGYLLEGLARMGAGMIRAADGDVFDEHNLNRQLLGTVATVGQPKAVAAADRMAVVNPAVDIEIQQRFLKPEKLPAFMAGADVVVDALGGLGLRLALQQACAQAGLPLVSGAMAGLTGWVSVIMPGQRGPADFLGQGSSAEAGLGTPPASVSVVAGIMLNEVVRLLTGGISPVAGGMLLIDLQDLRFERVQLG